MGIADRKERLRKKVRDAILRTAKDIARQEGWSAVSIRKIAAQIDYSSPVLYSHFNSKEHLLESIRAEGFVLLKTRFLEIKSLYRDPEKQLTAVAAAIWDFAWESPEVFQVMFNLEGAYCTSPAIFQAEMAPEENPVWEMIAAFRPRFMEAVSKTYYEWWTVTYGFIALTMTIKPPGNSPSLEPLYKENVRRYLRSIL